jgi:site-specific DNA recombinase
MTQAQQLYHWSQVHSPIPQFPSHTVWSPERRGDEPMPGRSRWRPALAGSIPVNRLASQAVERRCRIRGLPALLTGRLFDEQGRRMSPTHTNKKGVRYSYYVSQAVLRKHSAVLIGRVAAPVLETLIVDAVRRHVPANSTASDTILETDRELIERHLLRATLSRTAIILHLRQEMADAEASDPQDLAADSPAAVPTTVTIPWIVPVAAPVKGIVHVPAHNTPMKPGSRETLLIALAKTRNWIKGIERGQTLADIADREGKAERHVRHLVRLAFVSPRGRKHARQSATRSRSFSPCSARTMMESSTTPGKR